jgi:hypothetical protein
LVLEKEADILKQDIKISLPLYKVVYSFIFIILLSLIRGISSVGEIGSAVDINMALLAIIFCADTYYQEFQGGRWEIFSLLSIKKRAYVIRRRLMIEYIYLILLSNACYALFYIQRPYLEEGVSEIGLYGITISAVAASIVFFGIISMTLVNLTKNIWAGIGITAFFWLSFSSAASYRLPIPFQIFAFANRNLVGGNSEFLWIWGKVTAVFLALLFIILQSSVLRKGKR